MHSQRIHQPSVRPSVRRSHDANLLRKVSVPVGTPTPRTAKQTPHSTGNLGITTFLALVVAFLLPGLVGHDPWKQDETYVFGMIQHLLESGDWVVPMVAGEPFMEKPPLYYWIAAGSAWLFSPWLPLHDGARLATGFFMAVTCGALGWTGRHWWGRGFGRFSVLALLGCLGIVFYGHLMSTDIPLLTGFAVASCGFALARTRPIGGGLALGIGVGVGFLAKGMLAPSALGLTAVLLPICFNNWRSRAYFRTLAIALLTALPPLLIWPIALYVRSPSLFMDWFWLNNIGRFLGFSVPLLGAPHSEGFWSETIPWFTFPALPLALVTIWRHRRELLTNEPSQFSIVLFGVLITVLGVSASARPNYALPLLLPVCLLAGPATIALPVRIDRLWDWSARILFGSLAAIIWSVWAWMVVHGMSPDFPLLNRYLPSDFTPPIDFDDIAVAPWLTLCAIVVVWRQPKAPGRGVFSWVVGITLCWALIATLWLKWIDYAKSYRSVFASMQSSIPHKYRCVARSGLGESERAMLRYVLGINAQRQELTPGADCDLLLIDGLAGAPPKNIDRSLWKLVWEGTRPSDLREHFWLFKAVDTSTSMAAASR